jgi:L-lactate dehydrogenase complex protein LldG
MSKRDPILARLRSVPPPFGDVPRPDSRLDVAPVDDDSPDALLARFAREAEALSCTVFICDTEADAHHTLLDLLGDQTRVTRWALDRIPLPQLAAVLDEAGIEHTESADSTLRAGITGADAALAATGGLVLASAPGQPRHVSLLPETHIAIIRSDQIVANLEAWQTALRAAGLAAFRATSTTVVISGPSRTGDIGMELVMGAHGPREVAVIVLR